MKLYHEEKEKNNLNEIALELDFHDVEQYAKNGLLSLSVQIGLKVMQKMMEEEVNSHVGKKSKHIKERKAYRHGTEATKVVMGGQKIPTRRPRVRANDGSANGKSSEIPLQTLLQFQKEEFMNDTVLKRMLHGVSTRNYEHALDEIALESESISKSNISRKFQAESSKLMDEFMQRSIDECYPAIMLDGTGMGDYCVVVALGISAKGKKTVLGIREGSTENAMICTDLLNDVIERGLKPDEKRLIIIDGGKGLKKSVKDVFGDNACIQRCQIHKKRNVLSYLPESEKSRVKTKMNQAYSEFEYDEAKRKMALLAEELDFKYPSAAKSLLEGLEETLTVHKLGVPGRLRQTLSNTNPIESALSTTLNTTGRVKHWQSGDQVLRWLSAGFILTEKKFRAVNGYKQMPLLIGFLNQNQEKISKGKTG